MVRGDDNHRLRRLQGHRSAAALCCGQHVQDQQAELDRAVDNDVRWTEGWGGVRFSSAD